MDAALNARMVNLFAIAQMANATYLAHISQIAQMANATHLAQMSRFLAIQDNQAILKSNVAGAVSQLITERCNVDLAKMDGTIPLLNLRPCLRTIHPIKYRSVSFSDVYIGELDTLCPTLRHVTAKLRATNPDLIASNPGTKPSPSSVRTYLIEDNSCYYKQWKLDVLTNRTIKKDFFMQCPTFKKEYPGLRWFTTTNNHTRDNTQANQTITILSVTLAAEEQVFLSSLKKGYGSTAQQLGAVVDSGATRHAGNRYNDVLTFLPNSFLMYPAIGPPVKLPAVLLGVPTVTHAGVARTLPLPGAGVYDPTMREGLVSIAQLLAARYHVILRLPVD